MGAVYVQHLGDAALSTSATQVVITIPAGGVTAGHSIILTAMAGITGDSCTVTDDAGNTYTQDAVGAYSTTIGVRVFSSHNVMALTAGQHITVSWSAAHYFCEVSAEEFSGLAATGTFDTSATTTGSSTAFTTSALTTTGAADLLYAAFGSQNSGTTSTVYTPGTGFIGGHTLHAVAGSNGRELFTEWQTDVAAGTYTGTATASISHTFAGVMVAYVEGAVTGTASVTVNATGGTSATYPTSGTAQISIAAGNNIYPAVGAADVEVAAYAAGAAAYPTTGTASVFFNASGVPTQQHILVETDLTFRISTDNLIIDASVQTTDGVTSISGVGGDSRTLGNATAPTTDLTENSPLGSWNAGRSKARYEYLTRSVAKRDAPAVTLNVAPLVQQWTVGSAHSPSAYQAALMIRISDLVSLTQTPRGGGDPITALYYVEGKRQQMAGDGSQWIATLNLSRADISQGQKYWQIGLTHIRDGSVITW